MCTSIVEVTPASGAARSRQGWFRLSRAVVAYDHPQYAPLEEAVTLDFVDPAQGPAARAAVELTLESARALHAALAKVIEAAQAEEGVRETYASDAHPSQQRDAASSGPLYRSESPGPVGSRRPAAHGA